LQVDFALVVAVPEVEVAVHFLEAFGFCRDGGWFLSVCFLGADAGAG
jgi:hypothetical protein